MGLVMVMAITTLDGGDSSHEKSTPFSPQKTEQKMMYKLNTNIFATVDA